ncbi:hypothetical protein RDI58_017609 [Solanum bulbocastanum]|uniref:Uncharacterized protein n=1 Tax=Solanum bulbocastanum TaxID=147425 RepID=A0AAN8TBM2_SOLBU
MRTGVSSGPSTVEYRNAHELSIEKVNQTVKHHYLELIIFHLQCLMRSFPYSISGIQGVTFDHLKVIVFGNIFRTNPLLH